MQEVKFNLHIYDKRAIAMAVKDFSHLAKFKVSSGHIYIKVLITQPDQAVAKILIDEFSNYCLGVTKKCLKL